MEEIIFTVLGSGTSSGVPTIACKCSVCTNDNPKDKRLRSSILIQSKNTNIVIDSGPDFRQQMLINNVCHLDAIIYTHSHFDHIAGFDDLRAFNFINGKPVNIIANQETMDKLMIVNEYAFKAPIQIGGGIPLINTHIIDDRDFIINDIRFTPIQLLHGKIKVLGFRIGNFAYCTDTNFIPDESFEKLMNLDCLIIDGLKYDKHPTHFSISESIDVINKLKPKISYLTHISHDVSHNEGEETLPKNIHLAYDGLKIIL